MATFMIYAKVMDIYTKSIWRGRTWDEGDESIAEWDAGRETR